MSENSGKLLSLYYGQSEKKSSKCLKNLVRRTLSLMFFSVLHVSLVLVKYFFVCILFFLGIVYPLRTLVYIMG